MRMFANQYVFFNSVPRYQDAEQLHPSAALTEEEIRKRVNAQKRLCAYRALIFWTYPDIRRRERRPLPSCIYAMVRAMFPSEQDEEIWADLQHTVFFAEPDDE